MKVSTVKRYLAEHDIWTRHDEMRGSYHPDVRDAYHAAYLRSKRRLLRAIEKLLP